MQWQKRRNGLNIVSGETEREREREIVGVFGEMRKKDGRGDGGDGVIGGTWEGERGYECN